MRQPVITQAMQEIILRTEKGLMKDFFKCHQPPEHRAPECSGIGYGPGKDINVCSVCLTYEKISLKFSTGSNP